MTVSEVIVSLEMRYVTSCW